MSDLMKFVVYYGPGNVRTTPVEADLSEFQYVELELSAPQTCRVCQLKEWLTVNFGPNPEAYTVGVHALWTISTSKVFWHLKPIDQTSQWVIWVCLIGPIALVP
jgi:hypothetical protein